MDEGGSNWNGKSVSERYEKKTPREHILLRPDSYIGTTEMTTEMMWVFDDGMVHREIVYVPGLYKIFDEILVNAADHKQRCPTMKNIKVEIDENTISIFNDGEGIPVEIHSKEKIWIPSLIFGHLLTSSNYDDEEERVTGGRNGFGAKLTNIFSTEFTVETCDKDSGKKFVQTWNDNMTRFSKPKITKCTTKEYTKVTFTPDLEKFGMTHLDKDIIDLMTRRVYDIAGCNSELNVWLNGEKITFTKAKGFEQYCRMYLEEDDPFVTEICNERWQVGVSLSKSGERQQVSFVNSINTKDGGTHVDYISNQIAKAVVDAVMKKKKDASIKPAQVRNHMWVFVNSHIVNPSFKGQTKETLTTKVSDFGSVCKLSPNFMKKSVGMGLVESVLQWVAYKENINLNKTSGKKKVKITGIKKLDDANDAGTKKWSKDCTLILTEGDSAKALAISGLSVVGRNRYGVFPLRGKLLNVRDASSKAAAANEEISSIIQIIGLKHGQVYDESNIDELRYGKIMIMTDQDHDGSHIKGLVINMVHTFWPSLIQMGFLEEFITPIIKAKKGKKEILFYTIPEYEEWKVNDEKGYNIKYYKGLGTSTAKEAVEYFKNIDQNRILFDYDEADNDRIDLAFRKTRADDRKNWINAHQDGNFIDTSSGSIGYSEFIDKELVLFSIADNFRSIPSMVDGLKPGQRKILFSCFKRNLKDEIKVAQLAGYVSEHSAYHHGEASLHQTIIGMAQDFVGSNNVNLLYPAGQFGTRLQGGKDAASPRYIFTRLTKIARMIFPEYDDYILDYLNDDGQSIEPKFYVPIIPLVLVNGSEGIGTGWSTKIPNYSLVEIAQGLKSMLKGGDTPWLDPSYRNFKGKITGGVKSYDIEGLYEINGNKVTIRELPVGVWTQNYKEFLEKTDKKGDVGLLISDVRDNSTDTEVEITVKFKEGELNKLVKGGTFEKRMKLSTTGCHTTNMHLFDRNGKIVKYESVQDIMDEFYDIRISFYAKRKEFMVERLQLELDILNNKVRFLKVVVSEKFKVTRKKDLIIKDLEKRKYVKFSKVRKASGDSEDEASYDYLLSMPIWNLTVEKVKELQKQRNTKQSEYDLIQSKSLEDMWIEDLDVMIEEYLK